MNSPCTGVCYLDAQGYCLGCLRTSEEIAKWPYLDHDEQSEILWNLETRRAQADA